MTAAGSLTVEGRTFTVDGKAWFDHQWGDFISVGGGGWDWFAIDLADGTDLTLSLVRAADGTYPLAYGTLVDVEGRARNLDASAFTVTPTGFWRARHPPDDGGRLLGRVAGRPGDARRREPRR